MYSYNWDIETGGLLLNTSPLSFSKEPRPVFYKELDILGFDKLWNYSKSSTYPYMWAEANNYYYRGRLVAKAKGGALYAAPEIILVEDPEPEGMALRFIDIPAMVEKNRDLLEKLTQDTIKRIYNTYVDYKDKIDVFYVAFSGGKDSIVVLDLVQRALPHNKFKVLFGDTGMEFPDTYEAIDKIEELCIERGIDFARAKSKLTTELTWSFFGPPAVTNRWCCSVHKTSPQVMLLQEQTKNQSFTGMAYTGIRADESASRSDYDEISYGGKHRGQYSCHPILEWNSAEVFSYIFQEDLTLNEAYRKGNNRAGCLVCPMSSGKHEYMKQQCYPEGVDVFIKMIIGSSGKTSFSESEMMQFIKQGNWKTRKTGRELNFGQDHHMIETEMGKISITVFVPNPLWKEWAKTIGGFSQVNDDLFTIDYKKNVYEVRLEESLKGSVYTFPNCGTSKDDIKFISLFRSVIIKSIYCVRCGVCVANCAAGCINMINCLSISDNCIHCYQCHDIYEHCLRYNSIRNKTGGAKGNMKGLDRYFSFGIRKGWLELYFNDQGSVEFWNTDGHGNVPNKKKDAFLNFLKDSGLVTYKNAYCGDKYTKNEPSILANMLFSYGTYSEVTWAMLLCNLVYTPEFKWFVKSIKHHERITPDKIKYMLEDVMENDAKGLGRRNVSDAFKILLIKTPFGSEIGLGHCDYDEKVNALGNETITLNSFYRDTWKNPEPLVILYALYKFAEACGNYHQFTLNRLLNHDIDSDGVSPTEIFGLDRDQMEKILTGLSINHSDFIMASFTLDLDNITLNSDKTSQDVLTLF